MIDCGEASQLFLKDNHIRMQRISHVFISHLHGDHYFGLVGLLSSMHLFGRKHPLHLFAPPELEQIIRMQLDAGGTVLQYPLFFHSTRDRSVDLLFEDKELEVYSFPLRHGLPTTGFLFKEKPRTSSRQLPKSFAYCSDTIYDVSIIPYIRQVDLLYHETTFLESEAALAESRFHTTARQAAQIARQAEVGRLMIGHYSARYSNIQDFVREASEVFPTVIPASEGLVYTI